MIGVLSGVLPVFFLIALGWGLRRRGFLHDDGWKGVERLSYVVLYPSFLIPAVWGADFGSGAAGPVALSTVGVTLAFALVTLMLRPLIRVDGPGFTSVFQGVIRWNGFVFLPVAMGVLGPESVGLASLAFGVLAPAVNVICVLVLTRWGADQASGWRGALRSLSRNPIILSCAAGALLNVSGLEPEGAVASLLRLTGEAAVPLGLLVVGAGLSFTHAAGRPVTLGLIALVKLVALPLTMFWVCGLLGGDRTAQGVALLAGAAPGAAAAYVMARQMGGDAKLMAGSIAFTTVGSAFTIPLLLIGLGYA
jgi:malonate transporter